MGEKAVSGVGDRDILVTLREELLQARQTLNEVSLASGHEKLEAAARRLQLAAQALDARIHAPFDALLLERSAASFRNARAALDQLLEGRRQEQRRSPQLQRVLKRVAVHAREIGRMTHESGADHVGAAIDALGQTHGWSGPPLDALVTLVDTLYFLSRARLGPSATDEQLDSLVDRASSTAVVTVLHALKELAHRVRSEPTLMKDRFALDQALKVPSSTVSERLAGWLKLDAAGRGRLQLAMDAFTKRLLDKLVQPAGG